MKYYLALGLFVCTLASLFADTVSVTPLAFDAENQRWPLQIGGQKAFWDLSRSVDLAAEYQAVQSLLEAKKLVARVVNQVAELGASDASPFRVLARVPLAPNIDAVTVIGGSFRTVAYQKRVSVSDFAMAKTAVTQDLYQAITGGNPSVGRSDADSPQRPVENLTWFEAVLFCNALSQATGLSSVYTVVYDAQHGVRAVFADPTKNGWRLPTAAEYEFAARGGNSSRGSAFAGGNATDAVAWTSSNSGGKSHPVATKAPNELGLFDLSGNVSSYCWDLEGGSQRYEVPNPQGPWAEQFQTERVIMGGSYLDSGWNSPLAVGGHVDGWRYQAGMGSWIGRSPTVGLRLVRSLGPAASYASPLLSSLTPPPASANPDALLAAVVKAGTNRVELDQVLRPLVTAKWTTDAGLVSVKSVRPSARTTTPMFDPLPGYEVTLESSDPLLHWSGTHTYFGNLDEVSALFKAGKLHAQIDWMIVPLSLNLYTHRITDIRLVTKSPTGEWRLLSVMPEAVVQGLPQPFLPFQTLSFDPAQRQSATELTYLSSVRVEGNADLQSFYMAQHPVTYGQWATVFDLYENGAIRRTGVWQAKPTPLAEDGVVGYTGLSLISPSKLLEAAEQVRFVEAANWCNLVSVQDGLEPVYTVNQNVVHSDLTKNGWRLPTIEEYEWARLGGQKSKGFKVFAGSDNPNDVVLAPRETENSPWISGAKKPNELGLFDMTGNVKIWLNDRSPTWAASWLHQYIGLAYFQDAKDILTSEQALKILDGGPGTRESRVQDAERFPGLGFRPVRPDGRPVAKVAVPPSSPAPKTSTQPAAAPTAPQPAAPKVTPPGAGQVDLYRVTDGAVQKRVDGLWVKLDGVLEGPHIDREGNLWSVTSRGALSRFNGKELVPVRGLVFDLAFGSDQKVYVVSAFNRIEVSQAGGEWTRLSPPFAPTAIAAGKDGALWALSQAERFANGKIYRFDGAAWQSLPGLANSIAVDPQGVAWVSNEANEIYRWNGAWVRMPGVASKVVVGNSGDVFALGAGSASEERDILKWDGKDWIKVGAGATDLAAP